MLTLLIGIASRNPAALTPLLVFKFGITALLLVGAAVIFVLYREAVSGIVDHAVLGSLVAYAVFPLTLLAFVEILGRVLQGSLRS